MQSARLLFMLLAAGVFTAALFPKEEKQAAIESISASTETSVVGDTDALERNGAGLVLLEGIPFTGTQVKHEGDLLIERSRFVAGLRHGLTERWYPNGMLSYRATYLEGRRHGTVETWWAEGGRRAEAHYEFGIADGIQREWYRSGAPFKELHLVNGREYGLQRAWRENGALYANYEARDGRIFGLKRANLCYELDGEQLVIQ